MIVSCPTCGTRYRHAASVSAARLGRCSRCDETFELVRRGRPYLLLPAGHRSGITEASLAAPIGPGLTTHERPAEPAGQPAAPVSSRAAWRVMREWSGLLLLTALGTAAGFHGAGIANGDPLTWAAVGAVAGLVFGWSWIRAAERKR